MTAPMTCEPTEEQRARAVAIAGEYLLPFHPPPLAEIIAQALVQESSRANERAEGLQAEVSRLQDVAKAAQELFGVKLARVSVLPSEGENGGTDIHVIATMPGGDEPLLARLVGEWLDRTLREARTENAAEDLLSEKQRAEGLAKELEALRARLEIATTIAGQRDEQCARADKAEAELAKLREQVGAQPAAQPPPGSSVALREALDEVCESLCGRRAIDHDAACNALRAALATAPAEGERLRALPDGLAREILPMVFRDGWRTGKNAALTKLGLMIRAATFEELDGISKAYRAVDSIAAPLPSAQQVGAAGSPLAGSLCGESCTGKDIPREEHICGLPAGHLDFHWDKQSGAQWSGGNRRAAEIDAPSELASSVAPAVPDTGHSTTKSAGHNPEGVVARAEETDAAQVGGVYVHRKGGMYRVEAIALESTNGRPRERVVAYRGSNGLNVRTEREFLEWVEGAPRFKFLHVTASRLAFPAEGPPAPAARHEGEK